MFDITSEIARQKAAELRTSVNPFEMRADPTVLDRSHFHTEFKTDAYLKDFYTRVDDPAMQVILCFLPNLVARLPHCDSLLDFGAGPTIHVAVAFRDKVDEIHLADYLPQNRDELNKWKDGTSTFDWTNTLNVILNAEGSDIRLLRQMETLARPKVRNVMHCDCLQSPAVFPPKDQSDRFDIITTIFCIEYCCKSLDEYRQAIANVVQHIKPGGYFVMGGIMEETWCSFGGRKFTCLYLTEEMMMNALRQAGLDVNRPIAYFEINGIFMICVQKLVSNGEDGESQGEDTGT